MKHEQLDDAAREQAALYALSTLTEAEAEDYGAHLTECPRCREAVIALGQTMSPLPCVPQDVPPPADLKKRLFDRLFGNEAVIVPAAESDWQETEFPGVEMRHLFVDEPADRVTCLVRMAPMSDYPAHQHSGTEECYVIEGDLWNGKIQMTTRDYSRFPGGSEHGPLSTESGCLLFIQSSRHDEMLEVHG